MLRRSLVVVLGTLALLFGFAGINGLVSLDTANTAVALVGHGLHPADQQAVAMSAETTGAAAVSAIATTAIGPADAAAAVILDRVPRITSKHQSAVGDAGALFVVALAMVLLALRRRGRTGLDDLLERLLAARPHGAAPLAGGPVLSAGHFRI